MAIKKAKVNFSEIANANPITLPDGSLGFPIRYRLTSDDKNRKSQWSPVYIIIPGFDIDVVFQSLDGGTIIDGGS
jgi:hypothetical protein